MGCSVVSTNGCEVQVLARACTMFPSVLLSGTLALSPVTYAVLSSSTGISPIA